MRALQGLSVQQPMQATKTAVTGTSGSDIDGPLSSLKPHECCSADHRGRTCTSDVSPIPLLAVSINCSARSISDNPDAEAG